MRDKSGNQLPDGYRPDISGLRALAVLSVIFYHLKVPFFVGGYLGVDIFFVISGYLITGIINRDIQKNNFNLKYFFEKRIKRIIPAYTLTIFITLLLSNIYMVGSDLRTVSLSAIFSSLFSSNIYFWRDSGYFGGAFLNNPLLHTWTLSVEEQFYIFFPIFMLVLMYISNRVVLFILSTICVCSFLLANWGSSNYVMASFFLLPTRGWEFLIGSILAIKKISFFHMKDLLRGLLYILGILLIIFSILYFNEQTPTPSIYTAIPLLGAVLILVLGEQSNTAQILDCVILEKIGLISYSAYLIHIPIIVFYSYFYGFPENFIEKILTVLVIVFLSSISFRYVENHFRFKSKLRASRILVFSVALIFIVSIFTYIRAADFEKKQAIQLLQSGFIYESSLDDRKLVQYQVYNDTETIKTIAVGSSRLMQLPISNVDSIRNFSVSGADLEDIVSITMMSQRIFDAEKIIIGIDPWILNKNRGDRWKTLNKEYRLALFELSEVADDEKIELDEKIFELQPIENVSFDYSEVDLSRNILFKNGYRHLGKATSLNILPQQENINIVSNYGFYKYELDQDALRILRQLLSKLSSSSEVVIILSPYSQQLYSTLQDNHPILANENIIRNISKELNIQIYGSYDPSLTNCLESEFMDLFHPNSSCMGKIFNDY